MNVNKSKFQLEEYKQLWAEIHARESAIGRMFTFTVTISVSIFSGVAAIATRGNFLPSGGFAYAFLGPLALIVPNLFVIASHRRDEHRLGAYLRVFYEDPYPDGPRWGTRLEAYRSRLQGESLDLIPWTFWAIAFICTVGYLISVSTSGVFPSSLRPDLREAWVYIQNAIPLLPLVLLAFGHRRFSLASSNVHDGFYRAWCSIRDEEAISRPLETSCCGGAQDDIEVSCAIQEQND